MVKSYKFSVLYDRKISILISEKFDLSKSKKKKFCIVFNQIQTRFLVLGVQYLFCIQSYYLHTVSNEEVRIPPSAHISSQERHDQHKFLCTAGTPLLTANIFESGPMLTP